mmetsp:Transcript_32846/g.38018  ORF Transcript_32846/g.38018 Transcript_32846/m.38018 type:complete len:80 (+) Transcript_32846:463-702(+)
MVTHWVGSISCVRVRISWTLLKKTKPKKHLCSMDNQLILNDKSSLPKTHKQTFGFTNTHIFNITLLSTPSYLIEIKSTD